MQFPSSKTQTLRRFQTGPPLKGRVNQGSAEELIVLSSIFHSCASQVAPGRYSREAGKRSERAAGARTCSKSAESEGEKREETVSTA